jgi:hypothetical protein
MEFYRNAEDKTTAGAFPCASQGDEPQDDLLADIEGLSLLDSHSV